MRQKEFDDFFSFPGGFRSLFLMLLSLFSSNSQNPPAEPQDSAEFCGTFGSLDPSFGDQLSFLPKYFLLFDLSGGRVSTLFPGGACSSRGHSRHLLETFSEPLLRALLRTLFHRKTHSSPPSENPSENPFPRTLPRTFPEAFLERCVPLGMHPIYGRLEKMRSF